MLDPISILARKGITTTSFSGAVQDIKEKDQTVFNWQRELNDLMGELAFDIDDEELLRYTYLYVVQAVVRNHILKGPIDYKQLMQKAFDDAKVMVYRVNEGDMSFVKATGEDDSGIGRKASKGDMAVEIFNRLKENGGKKAIIQAFMDELDMSKAGATTYYYATKKKVEEE